MSPSSILCKCTLKTSFTAVISSGPTPSPGTIVTLKVASARAGGVSGLQRPADTLSGREANCGHLEPTRPWRRETKVHLLGKVLQRTLQYTINPYIYSLIVLLINTLKTLISRQIYYIYIYNLHIYQTVHLHYTFCGNFLGPKRS